MTKKIVLFVLLAVVIGAGVNLLIGANSAEAIGNNAPNPKICQWIPGDPSFWSCPGTNPGTYNFGN